MTQLLFMIDTSVPPNPLPHYQQIWLFLNHIFLVCWAFKKKLLQTQNALGIKKICTGNLYGDFFPPF